MSNIPDMKDLRPFIFNAYWSWMSESGVTPYIHVNTNHPGVRVPQNFVQPDGSIVLSISFNASPDISIDDDTIVLNASFGGKRERIIVPIQSILTIFAKENARIGTNLYSPEESTGADVQPVSIRTPDSQQITVDIPDNDICTTSSPVSEGPSIAEKVQAKLKLVSNDHSNGDKNITERRAKLRVLH